MKVRSKIFCTGIGYEMFKTGEVRDLKKSLASLLIEQGYAEEVLERKKKKTTEEVVI